MDLFNSCEIKTRLIENKDVYISDHIKQWATISRNKETTTKIFRALIRGVIDFTSTPIANFNVDRMWEGFFNEILSVLGKKIF